MPVWMQHALIYGVSMMYHAEKGDFDGESRERQNKDTQIDLAYALDGRAFANQRVRLGRPSDSLGRFEFYNPAALS